MRKAVDDLGQTIVMVSHDPVAAAYADRVVFLVDGRIVARDAGPDRGTGDRPDEVPRGRLMLRVTLRSFWEHKRRLISTVIAIVLGVAFMAGTFVLTDTLDKVFDDLFAEGNANVDAQVQGEVLFSDPFAGGDQRRLLDADLVDVVAAVDGVAEAEPSVVTLGFGSNNRVLDPDGEPIGSSNGPPTLLESWIPGSNLTAYNVAEGRGPEADDELALNVAAANDAGFEVGDTVTLVTQLGRNDYTLVGTVLFGTAESSAGTVSVELTLAEVQRIAGTDGRIQTVLAGADEGVSQQQLADAHRRGGASRR